MEVARTECFPVGGVDVATSKDASDFAATRALVQPVTLANIGRVADQVCVGKEC